MQLQDSTDDSLYKESIMEIPEANEDMEYRRVNKKFLKNTSTHEIMSAQRSRDYTKARVSPNSHARASPSHF